MDQFNGKSVLITGGARGIGLATAQAFATQGASVCVCDLSQAACDEAARRIGSAAIGLALDVTDVASIADIFARAAASLGGIDVLINCAGTFGLQNLLDVTFEDFSRIFAVNTCGVLFCMQAAARIMVGQHRGGAIVNIASSAGRRGVAGATVYSASKAAVISLTQSAAHELIRSGIRVNAIAPGAIQTQMFDEFVHRYDEISGMEDGKAAASLLATVPAGRIAPPSDIANVAVFLASDESAYMLGQTLNVDGGMYFN